MSKIFVLTTLILLMSSCTQKNTDILYVNGTIDEQFNGQKIYFCPQPKPTADIVDSTIVRNGHFNFKIPADSCYVADITLSRRAPGFVERILIAVEPGTLEVCLAVPSKAGGTPKNDVLQSWKESFLNNTDREGFMDQTYKLILDNPDYLGGYLYSVFSNALDEQQTRTLDSLGYQSLIPDVTTRK